jgi:hypothetical protein
LSYRPDEDGTVEEGVRSVGYLDADDRRFDAYGRAAGHADARAIASTVTRYYAAARLGEASLACSLMARGLAAAVARDYAQPRGSRQPLGGNGNTCAAGMGFVMREYRQQLSAPITVTAVRVKGRHALALIGSPKLRAAYLTLYREAIGDWRVHMVFAGGMS